jgi:hypothetical protein
MRFVCFLVTVLWILVAVQTANATDELSQGLLLYMPFEGSTAPSFCMGRAEVHVGGGSLSAGRVGGGFQIVGNASVSLPAIGNFDRHQGTIAFWHLPHWKAEAAEKGQPVLMHERNFQLVWSASRQTMWFMTGSGELEIGFHWDYSVATKEPSKWGSPQWHHFAVTWDSKSGEKQLFLDGHLAAQGKTRWIRSNPLELCDEIVLGSAESPGIYDEWAIWNRRLSEAEIALLARQPAAAAKVLARRKSPLDAATPVAFELVRLKPTETTVEPGETFRLPVTAVSLARPPLHLALRLSLVDAFGEIVQTSNATLDLQPSEKKPLKFDLHADRNGVYKLRAEMDDGGRTFRKDLGGFAVWPKGRLKPRADSFFGYHVNAWSAGAYVEQAEQLGLSWQRNHDMLQTTWWVHVQPEPGPSQWTYDFQLEYFKQARMPVLGEFFATPYWAVDTPLGDRPKQSDKATHRLKPRLDAFENYVRMCVLHYKDYIHAWEVWNEPEAGNFWNGTPEEYGQLAQVACRTAKAADPNCTLLVGSLTSVRTDWVEHAAKTGAFVGADGVSFHSYAKDLPEFRRTIELVQKLAKRFSPPGKKLELWNTEWGVTDTTFYVDADLPHLPARHLLPASSFLDGAAAVVKRDCLSMALGVKHSFYYLHSEVDGASSYSNFSAIEYTRTPRAKLIARMALEDLTCGTKSVELFERNDPCHMTAVVFSQGNSVSLAALWLEEETDARLISPPGKNMMIFNIFGNPIAPGAPNSVSLSATPVYVTAKIPAAEMAALLQTAKMVRP